MPYTNGLLHCSSRAFYRTQTQSLKPFVSQWASFVLAPILINWCSAIFSQRKKKKQQDKDQDTEQKYAMLRMVANPQIFISPKILIVINKVEKATQ